MLVVKSQEHFDKVRAQAETLGIMDKLQQQLDYLGQYANHTDPDNTRCELYNDFAPLSFSFVMFRKSDSCETEVLHKDGYERWFSGGLIYHPGSTGPDNSFSVELIRRNEPHWSVHT